MGPLDHFQQRMQCLIRFIHWHTNTKFRMFAGPFTWEGTSVFHRHLTFKGFLFHTSILVLIRYRGNTHRPISKRNLTICRGHLLRHANFSGLPEGLWRSCKHVYSIHILSRDSHHNSSNGLTNPGTRQEITQELISKIEWVPSI